MRKIALAYDQAHETLQRQPSAFKLDQNDHYTLVIMFVIDSSHKDDCALHWTVPKKQAGLARFGFGPLSTVRNLLVHPLPV